MSIYWEDTMKNIDSVLTDFFKEQGYFHKEERTETYKCKPYKRESVMYAKPMPDPEGTDEFTRTITEEVVNPMSSDAQAIAVSLEQYNELNSLRQELAATKSSLCEKMDESTKSLNVIKNIMIGYAVLTILNLLTVFIFTSKFLSLLS